MELRVSTLVLLIFLALVISASSPLFTQQNMENSFLLIIFLWKMEIMNQEAEIEIFKNCQVCLFSPYLHS